MTNKAAQFAQPGIFVEGAVAGHSLEWTLAGDAKEALAKLASLDNAGAVIGIGTPLVSALRRQMPGLLPFPELVGKASMPATQYALWALVTDQTPGGAFAQAEALNQHLEGPLQLAESQPLFRYRDGRDLTGYKDGTANPAGEAAAEAALIADGPRVGASFALVQRYVHFRSRFSRLPQEDRDDVIGRRLSDNEEMEDAPETSHVKRTDQEGYETPAFMVRRSMPWGDLRTHGLQFIAFAADLTVIDVVLRRMCGLIDGEADALLRFTQAETGSYYYCPPMRGGRLDLAGLL
ncbi:Dyp-type peroxidase [Telmatospirillum sp.]|uniref:Dyp-type peroxidase n=1 Tax=Telmatospirillum sp. TaxID=2079197 RepID=UPI00283FD6FD|nr:Dyp-type peroxidase [Telmatospirillum sp.]MDR3440175.1 Dyp-type peroxidase [Telmatospirillum sp.]